MVAIAINQPMTFECLLDFTKKYSVYILKGTIMEIADQK